MKSIKNTALNFRWNWLFLVYTLIISVARTIRQPNDWSEAHWLIGYQLGVYKRGFIGTIVTALFGYEDAHIAEKFIFGCSILLVIIFIWILFRIYQNAPFPIGIVMATSPFIMMFGHIIAYFDYFSFILTFLSLYCIKIDKKMGIPFLLILGLLIHESIAFIGFPIIILALLANNKQSIYKNISEAIKLFSVPALFLFLLIFFIESGTDASVKKQSILQHLHAYKFVAIWLEIVADAYITSFIYYLKTQLHDVPNRLFKLVYIPIYINIIFFIAYFHFILRKKSTKNVIIPLVYIVVLSPLLLHFIAWDTTRIWVYPLLQTSLLFYVFGGVQTMSTQITKHTIFLLCIGMTAMNIIYEMPLVDDIPERFTLTERLVLNIPILLYLIFRYASEIRKDKHNKKAEIK